MIRLVSAVFGVVSSLSLIGDRVWTAAIADERPDVIIFLCDDLGYGDLGICGHPHIQTPQLDRLAREGIRFTNFYAAAPVCSPSRAGLLTGRSPNRAGIYDWIPPADGERARAGEDGRELVHLRGNEVTLPQLLRKAGYATCLTGKWHCNSRFNSPDQPQPDDLGFDHWLATQNNAAPSHENPANLVRNGQPIGPTQGFSCQIMANEAITWLEQHTAEHPEQPFFLYVAFHEPHEPIVSPRDLVDAYLPVALCEDQAQYFASVHNVDIAAGRILQALEELQRRENTLVVFTSDNGPETLNRYPAANRSWGTAGKLRAMKLHTHDGGLRVPGIVNWPRRIRPGQVVDAPASSLDLLPTLCELAGQDLPKGRMSDGLSLAGFLHSGKFPARSQPLVWAYYNALNDGRVAMRHGPWKVLAQLNSGTVPKLANLAPRHFAMLRQAELTDFEIYHIETDPGESEDLAASGLPETKRLISLLNDRYQELLSDSPTWPSRAAGDASE